MMAELPDLYGTCFVYHDGPSPNDWMFVGEAPAIREEQLGLPFQGPSGRLLNQVLEFWTNLRREDVYVTNIVKQRNPNGDNPRITEARKHLPYFIEELEAVNPKVVVVMGAVALKVFDKAAKVTADHGIPRPATLGNWSGLMVPWLHPAFALRFPKRKQQLANDARRLETLVGEHVVADNDYTLGADAEVAAALYPYAWAFGTVGFDTETTSPTRGNGVFATDEAAMVGWSASIEEWQGWYVPGESFGLYMARMLESEALTKVCHNAKFEHKILAKCGVNFKGFEDTKIAAYVLGETPTGLKTLAKQWLQVLPETYSEVTQGKDMSELAPEDIMSYAAADADNTLRLWHELEPLLHSNGVYDLYKNVELPLVPVLAEMEGRGVLIDLETVDEVIGKLAREIMGAEYMCRKALEVEPEFNVASPDQLEARLSELGAPLRTKTKGGKRYSVDAVALQKLAERGWRPDITVPLLEYRKLAKLLSYAAGWPALRGPDGRLHPAMNQSGHFEEAGGTGEAPSTGRLSSSGPNIQNIPNHRALVGDTDWGYELRQCFIAPDDYVIMTADLGQEEPRIIAVIAGDETILKAAREGRDIYRPATEAIYPYTVSDDADDVWAAAWTWERFIGKQFFLARYYGAGEGRLRKLDMTLTPRIVKDAVKALNVAHPALQPYLNETWEMIYADGFASSMYGRKRWFPEAWSRAKKDREEALRQAANMRVQATAADILKMALPKIHDALRGMRSGIIFTIHDEVALEVHVDEVADVARIVQDTFAKFLPEIGLPIEVKVGKRWGDRNKYEEVINNAV